MHIGIDVGGSHIGLGIINKTGKIIFKKEQDISYKNEEKPKEKLIDDIYNMIIASLEEAKIKEEKIESIGIAFPGTISGNYVVKAENLGIENLNIKPLEKRIKIPVYIRNDAKCAALAEKKYGNIKKHKDILFLTIGTGVGGAVFLDGKLIVPSRYEALEVGHMTIKIDGRQCNCGNKGCFEAYASMKRFKEDVKKELKLKNIDGKKLKEEIVKGKNLKILSDKIDEYIKHISIGIANLVNIFEPQVVCIGGGFVYYKDIFLEKLKKEIVKDNKLYNEKKPPEIICAKLENDAGIIGASLIYKEK